MRNSSNKQLAYLEVTLRCAYFYETFVQKRLQSRSTSQPCPGATTPPGNRRFSVTPTLLKPSNWGCRNQTHNQTFLSTKALIGEDVTSFSEPQQCGITLKPPHCCRVATPFGGFDRAPKTITFKLPELDLNPPSFPELQAPGMKRPSFNRTAQGWITEGTHMIIPTITLESMKVPESDDL